MPTTTILITDHDHLVSRPRCHGVPTPQPAFGRRADRFHSKATTDIYRPSSAAHASRNLLRHVGWAEAGM